MDQLKFQGEDKLPLIQINNNSNVLMESAVQLSRWRFQTVK